MIRAAPLGMICSAVILVSAPRLVGQQPGTIQGTVIEQLTKAPLSGATVRVQGTRLSAQTNVHGRFAIPAVPPGDYTLVAALIGYRPVSRQITVAPATPIQVDFAMQSTPATLNELVVTATKTATEVRDVAASVNVVSSEAIQQSGATTMMEAVQNAPGVTAAAFGENFQSIQLRGLPRLGNENETVLILLDGVPQTDARNSAQLTTLPVDIVDHIELVKGPTSSLYGRTAVAGVVNVLTKEPPSTPSFGAHAQAGAFGYVRTEASAGGPIGAGNRSGYFVSWLADRHESFHDQPIKRRQSSVFGKFTSMLGTRTSLTVTGNYASNRGGTPAPVPIVDGQLLSDVDPTFSRFTNLNLPFADYNQEDARAMGKLTQILNDKISVTNTFGYRHSLYNFDDDGDVLSPPAPGSTDVILFPFTHRREENAYFDDLHLEANMGNAAFGQRLIVGASYERNTGARTSVLPYTDTTTFGVLVDYRNPIFPERYDLLNFDIGGSSYTTTFYGFYAQDELTLTERLHLSAGARYDINHLTSEPVAPATGSPVDGTFRKLSPKVGLSYRLVNGSTPQQSQVNVYAQYSRAFLPPIAAIDPQSVRLSPPAPEDITNYEAGFKGTTFGGRFSFDVAAFYLKRDGIPIQVRTGGNTFALTNGGIQKFPGVEIGLGGSVLSNLTLHANYAYYGGKFGTFRFVQNDQDVDLTDHRISLSPHHVVDVGATAGHPSGLGLTLAGRYEGSRYLDNTNTLLLGSYFTVDGQVRWHLLNYTAAVSVSNIFNEKYETDGDIGLAQFVFPGSRRRIVAELDANF
jgi:iron complex outermembrane recepter protein